MAVWCSTRVRFQGVLPEGYFCVSLLFKANNKDKQKTHKLPSFSAEMCVRLRVCLRVMKIRAVPEARARWAYYGSSPHPYRPDGHRYWENKHSTLCFAFRGGGGLGFALKSRDQHAVGGAGERHWQRRCVVTGHGKAAACPSHQCLYTANTQTRGDAALCPRESPRQPRHRGALSNGVKVVQVETMQFG